MKVFTEMSKCIIGFDVWGTLLDLEKIFKILVEVMSTTSGIKPSTATELIFRVYDEMKTLRRVNPSLKPRELLLHSRRALAQALNTPEEKLDEALNGVFINLEERDVVFPDVLPALRALKSKGIRMGIIGNVLFWPSNYTIKLLKRVKILPYIEYVVFSDEVGVSKPDREIFLAFSKIASVDLKDVIYVGDNIAEDVGGALASGAVGVLIDRKSQKHLIVPELRIALIHDLQQVIIIHDAFCGG